MSNPFIRTVTKRKVIEGEKTLAGGAILKISVPRNDFLYLSVKNSVNKPERTGLTLPSLRELVDILTEICEVMEDSRK